MTPEPVQYSETTRSITVQVEPFYLEDQSVPEKGHFVWAYHVVIVNQGEEVVQLINRYWNITDAQGHVEEVRGPGVVGEQPILRPGESYEYTSGAPLKTPSGFMGGSYQMKTREGEFFDVKIPFFSLDSPMEQIVIN